MSGRSHWPEAILAFTGLGLILLGGCFLIGVATIYDVFQGAPVSTSPRTAGERVFVVVLYICAACCFAGAFTTLVMAVRRLMRS